MKTEATNPKPNPNTQTGHGCCGGAHKTEPKETPKESACGCGDKHAKEAAESSCCK